MLPNSAFESGRADQQGAFTWYHIGAPAQRER